MALSIPQILRQFKADVSKALAPETIVKICGYLGHKYRERVLDPVITVQVFLVERERCHTGLLTGNPGWHGSPGQNVLLLLSRDR